MRLALLVVIPICFWFSSVAAQEGPFVVEVVGEGSGGKQATLESVEQQARYDAMRKALDQAGVYLSSFTEVNLAVVTRDEIQAWTQGLVRVLEVLDDKCVFDDELKAFRCEITLKVEVRIGEMTELLKRVKADRAAQTVEAPALGFEYLFIGYRQMGDGSWGERRLEAGSTVRARDEIQIWFKPDRDCYAYVINRDAADSVYVLFPHEDAISNRLVAGQAYTLPSLDDRYLVDEVAGPETFYLAVSPTPMVDLAWIISGIKQGKGIEREGMMAMLDGTLKARGRRGLGKVVPGRRQRVQTPDGREITQVTKMLQGTGALVQVITLDHR